MLLRHPRNTAITRKRRGQFSRLCCLNRELTSRVTCGPMRNYWKCRATPVVPGTSMICSVFWTAKSASSRRLTRKARKESMNPVRRSRRVRNTTN